MGISLTLTFFLEVEVTGIPVSHPIFVGIPNFLLEKYQHSRDNRTGGNLFKHNKGHI